MIAGAACAASGAMSAAIAAPFRRRGFGHCEDADSDRFGQVRPEQHELLQVREDVLSCAAFRAALTRNRV